MELLYTIFIMFMGITCGVSQDCPRGWKSYMETCFLLVREPYDWFGAKGVCETVNANMVWIDDEGEEKFVISMLNETQYYHDPGCADKHANCAAWARTGECQRNPGYMLPNCQVSCNTCGGTVSNIWLGAEDFAVEGEFRWMHDGSVVAYSNWKQGQPDDAKHMEDCVMMDITGKWDDVHCESPNLRFGTVCEKRPEEDVIG